MRRIGQLIRLKPEAIAAYEAIHESVWPEVLATIHACNIRNYSIFRHNTLLFAYFEYEGEDLAADLQKMAADPKTQEWWTYTDPMQEPLENHAEGDWWTVAREVFHTD